MRRLRGETGIGSLARSLALFALLIQFTLPFSLAVASTLSDRGDPTAVFDCLGGAPLDDETGNTLINWHHCALPGGCCVAPALTMLDGVPGAFERAEQARLTLPVVERPISGRLPNQHLVRGPPSFF